LNSHRSIVISAIMCLFGFGCAGTHQSEECKEFFSHPSGQHASLIATYPLDKQIRLCRCNMDHRPPETGLSVPIAERGDSIIPALLDQLEKENNELTQLVIIDIFEVMSIKGTLRDRPDVVSAIQRATNRMKFPFKEHAERELNSIVKNNSE